MESFNLIEILKQFGLPVLCVVAGLYWGIWKFWPWIKELVKFSQDQAKAATDLMYGLQATFVKHAEQSDAQAKFNEKQTEVNQRIVDILREIQLDLKAKK